MKAELMEAELMEGELMEAELMEVVLMEAVLIVHQSREDNHSYRNTAGTLHISVVLEVKGWWRMLVQGWKVIGDGGGGYWSRTGK